MTCCLSVCWIFKLLSAFFFLCCLCIHHNYAAMIHEYASVINPTLSWNSYLSMPFSKGLWSFHILLCNVCDNYKSFIIIHIRYGRLSVSVWVFCFSIAIILAMSSYIFHRFALTLLVCITSVGGFVLCVLNIDLNFGIQFMVLVPPTVQGW